MNIIIREATKTDINNGLLNVFIEGYRFHQNGRPDIFINLNNEDLREDLLKNFETLSFLVILEDNNIVGYLAYEIKGRRAKKLHLDQLVISESFRGKGLGKKLMIEIKNITTKNNCNRIELDCWTFNKNALSFYEHLGFKKQRILYEMKIT